MSLAAQPHPIICIPDVESTVAFVDMPSMETMPVPWPRCQDLPKETFAKPDKDDLVLAVSHTWAYSGHPDPTAVKQPRVMELFNQAKELHKPQAKTVLFCDWLSVSQRPFRPDQPDRTPEEEAAFGKALRAFPQIYLQADAVLHIDDPTQSISDDRKPYNVAFGLLDKYKLVDNGMWVFVAKVPSDEEIYPDYPTGSPVGLFDIVDSVCGTPVKTVAEFQAAKLVALEKRKGKQEKQSSWSSYFSIGLCASTCSAEEVFDMSEVKMLKCPFGTHSKTPAGEKGWVYLERFASMVKGAMAHEDQVSSVAFCTSDSTQREIFDGARRLREGAQGGRQSLVQAMQYFVDQVEQKKFAAISLDKANNTGGMGGVDASAKKPPSDAEVVSDLMRELVDHLADNWEAEQKKQLLRQLAMAVNRGDVTAARQLIESGTDMNAEDARGMTCMHYAAKARNLDMANLLVNMGGDLMKQDIQGNSPAHTVALFSDPLTIELFKVLAPTEKILCLSNKAKVTVFERFSVWSSTAVNNKPYPIADDLVKQIARDMPNVPKASENKFSAAASLKTTKAAESKVKVKIGSQTLDILTFEPPAPTKKARGSDVKIDIHILWAGLALYMPESMQVEAVRLVASALCETYRAKIYFVGDSAWRKEDVYSNESVSATVLQISTALKLPDKFIFVENAMGLALPAVSKMADRISSLFLLNPLGWFSDEFLTSAGYQGMMNKVGEHAGYFAAREYEQCLNMFGAFMYSESPKDIDRVRGIFKAALYDASDSFFSRSGQIAQVFRDSVPMFKSLKGLDHIPTSMVCGGHAPALLVQDTIARLKDVFPNASVEYIPNSKQWWEAEGRNQALTVASFIAATIKK